jgi:hypothetical protein
MGCGLGSLDDINKGTIIIKQKTEMGFVSGSGMFDGSSAQKEDGGDDKELDELNGKVEEVTKKVA